MNRASSPDMKHIILPTAYLPPLSYMLMLMYHKKAYIDIHESYLKQSWRNRCRILTANGLLDMSIPVKKPESKPATIANIETSDHLPWRRNHWRSIASAYRKAPYFVYYADLIEAIFWGGFTGKLIDWNNKLLLTVINETGLDCQLSYTNAYIENPSKGTDYRQCLTPKQPWASFEWPEYYQVFGDRHGFKPDLSILDLLFNMGPDTLNYLQSCILLYKNTLLISSQDRQP